MTVCNDNNINNNSNNSELCSARSEIPLWPWACLRNKLNREASFYKVVEKYRKSDYDGYLAADSLYHQFPDNVLEEVFEEHATSSHDCSFP